MLLSTIIPITTIRAANVTILSSIPDTYIIATEINVLNGIVIAATIAERNGKRIIITIMIMSIERSKSLRKSLMLLDTTSGLSAILVICTSFGSSLSLKSFKTFSTSFP